MKELERRKKLLAQLDKEDEEDGILVRKPEEKFGQFKNKKKKNKKENK